MSVQATLWLAAACLAAAVIGGVLLVPAIVGALDAGLGLKPAAAISFGVTIVVLVGLLVAAGDGLIGEFQFVLPAFFLFFVFNWLLIAWIF